MCIQHANRKNLIKNYWKTIRTCKWFLLTWGLKKCGLRFPNKFIWLSIVAGYREHCAVLMRAISWLADTHIAFLRQVPLNGIRTFLMVSPRNTVCKMLLRGTRKTMNILCQHSLNSGHDINHAAQEWTAVDFALQELTFLFIRDAVSSCRHTPTADRRAIGKHFTASTEIIRVYLQIIIWK